MFKEIVALDLETTGLDSGRDAIIEVGLVRFSPRRVEEEFSTLINPGRPVPPFVTQLTGITDEMLADAPRFKTVKDTIEKFVGDLPVLGHNIEFDLQFLQKHGILKYNEALDTFAVASVVMPNAGRYNLAALSSALNVPLGNAHRALDDAHMTRQIYLRMMEKVAELPPELLLEINRLGEEVVWGGGRIFEDTLEDTGLVLTGESSYTPNLSLATVPAPPLESIEPRQPLDIDTIAARLEPGASTPAARLAVVREAKARGFSSGVMAMPLCPGISDSDESFIAVLSAAKDAGADFVYPGGLTLRPGCQKDLFLSLVDEHYPALRTDYDGLYGENRQSGMPRTERAAQFHARLDRLGRQVGLAQRIPFSVCRKLLSPPDVLFVLFCHMENLYSLRGVNTRPLRAATGRYADWLSGERTTLRRKRIPVVSSDPFPLTRILEERLDSLLTGTGGERSLAAILENDRLASLASAVLKEGANFDYGSLMIR